MMIEKFTQVYVWFKWLQLNTILEWSKIIILRGICDGLETKKLKEILFLREICNVLVMKKTKKFHFARILLRISKKNKQIIERKLRRICYRLAREISEGFATD